MIEEQRPNESREWFMWRFRRKETLAGKIKRKGLEARICLVCLKSSEKASVTRIGSKRECEER